MELTQAELRDLVIRPTLKYLDKHSTAAENLLIAIALKHQQQIHNQCSDASQCYGLFQISTTVHQAVWDKYLAFEPDLASKIRGLASQRGFLNSPHTELTTNLAYATAIAWAVNLAFPAVKHLADPKSKITSSAAGKDKSA